MVSTQPEPIPARAIYNAALGGAVAAAAGAAAWGLIVWLTDYEIGFAAVGIGLLVGWAVLMAGGRRRGLPLQIVAVAESVGGILVGKYVAVYLLIREVFTGELGITDPFVLEFITENPDAVFSLFDLLWFGLAIYTAWRFLAPQPPQPPQPAGPESPAR